MNNMMRKNNNRGGGNKHRSGGSGGQRRYGSNGGSGGGGNRGGQNDSQNIQRQKHHATQQFGKYSDLARNAQINGDRVDVEYYLQHVDHYTRILADIAAIEAERHAQQRESQVIPGGPNDLNAQHAQQDNGHESHGNDQQAHNDVQSGEQQPQQHAGGEQQQPRQRHQRRPHQEPSDNGAREANANREEIPLPGSILPPI